MIKFFRKIRQGLLEKGKFQQYALYAIGEILLVMIGILLALYVNNKNEESKALVKRQEILTEIKENLIFNADKFQKEIAIEQQVTASIDIVMKNLTETKIYHDSLDKHLHYCWFWPTSSWKTSGYETLKSHGVALIQSRQLRETIIDLHEITYSEFSEIDRNSEGYSQSMVIPIFAELLVFAPTTPNTPLKDYRATPKDYPALLQSKKMTGILSFWRMLRIAGIQYRQQVIEKNRELIGLIDRELEK